VKTKKGEAKEEKKEGSGRILSGRLHSPLTTFLTFVLGCPAWHGERERKGGGKIRRKRGKEEEKRLRRGRLPSPFRFHLLPFELPKGRGRKKEGKSREKEKKKGEREKRKEGRCSAAAFLPGP